MGIDDATGGFLTEVGYAARNFLLTLATSAATLKQRAEQYDPRQPFAVGLALGAAALHDRPWDADLASMVLKLADNVDRCQFYIFDDVRDVRQVFENRFYELQSGIWTLVNHPRYERNLEVIKSYGQEAREQLAAVGHRVKPMGDPILDFHIQEAIHALDHLHYEATKDLSKFVKAGSPEAISKEADRSTAAAGVQVEVPLETLKNPG
jgi:hypothetical protein